MTGDDGKRAMACLSAIRGGREWFDAKMAGHMAEHFPPSDAKEKATAAVRSDNAYHVAEFFYVARELGLMRHDRAAQLIARHNADMKELVENPTRAGNMDLSPQRVKDAIFSEEQQRKIFEGQIRSEEERIELDQSDLSKLLSPLMSPESCRQILVAMSKGGLLKARGYGRVFVTSDGTLENYFREHLVMIDRAIRGVVSLDVV